MPPLLSSPIYELASLSLILYLLVLPSFFLCNRQSHILYIQMAEDMYGMRSTPDFSAKSFLPPENLILPVDYQSLLTSTGFRDRIPIFGSDELLSAAASAISEAEAPSITPDFSLGQDVLTVIKAKIVSHPTYPRLLQAYIDCQKVIEAVLFLSQLPILQFLLVFLKFSVASNN